eukprot:g42806.t1
MLFNDFSLLEEAAPEIAPILAAEVHGACSTCGRLQQEGAGAPAPVCTRTSRQHVAATPICGPEAPAHAYKGGHVRTLICPATAGLQLPRLRSWRRFLS